MFEINLLRPPGLQVAVPTVEKLAEIDVEDQLINKLEERGYTSAVLTTEKKKSSIFRRLFLMAMFGGLLGVGLYWGYEAWLELNTDRILVTSVSHPASRMPSTAQPGQYGTPATVISTFLEHLPSQATIDFMDAGAGIMIYRMWGRELSLFLPQLNAMVDGHRQDDLLAPDGTSAPGYWLGTVAYNSFDIEGAMRPVEGDYSAFFDALQDEVSNTSGLLVEVVPGTVSGGEYVLSGSLRDLHGHLYSISSKSQNIVYHRISLVRQSDKPTQSYLLRVLFHLLEEQKQSLQLSSRGNSEG